MSRKPSLLATAIKTAEQPATAPALFETPEEPKPTTRSTQPAGSYVPPSRANKTAKTHHFLPV